MSNLDKYDEILKRAQELDQQGRRELVKLEGDAAAVARRIERDLDRPVLMIREADPWQMVPVEQGPPPKCAELQPEDLDMIEREAIEGYPRVPAAPPKVGGMERRPPRSHLDEDSWHALIVQDLEDDEFEVTIYPNRSRAWEAQLEYLRANYGVDTLDEWENHPSNHYWMGGMMKIDVIGCTYEGDDYHQQLPLLPRKEPKP